MFTNNKLKELTDNELISLYKKNSDLACVGLLYERYSHLIFGVCLKYLRNEQDAQDASINIFEKLLKDLINHDILNFPAWLHTVCRNFCLMQLRSANTQGKKESELQLVFDASMEIQQDSHLDNVNEKEMKLTVLEMCVEKLNEEQKRCIDLFYLKEKSYQEVATATNFTLNNVKSYIQNGKRNLKNCIESNK